MQISNQPRKRRRALTCATPENAVLSPLRTGELFTQTPPGQDVSGRGTSPKEGTRDEFDLFANLTDLVIEIGVATANNQVADSGQWHLATNHQDDRLPSSPLPTNDQARDPLSNISSNATNIHPTGTDSSAQHMQHLDRNSTSAHPPFVSPDSQVHGHCHDVDQEQRTGESISDTLRPERTGIGSISALLNHDNNIPESAFAITQDSIQDSEDGCTAPVSSVAGTENFRFQ